jgi:sugar lactone lactonase YvrE
LDIDKEKPKATVFRLYHGEGQEPEKMNVETNYQITCLGETTDPNVLICALNRAGFGRIDVNGKDWKVTELFNPLTKEEFGNGPHPETEYFNDGKVSPDGKFFVGTIDEALMYDRTKGGDHYWTMNGNNEMAPLLYRYDKEKGAEVQTAVGHFKCANGPTWSNDGSKFYMTCSLSGKFMEFDYDLATGTIKGEAKEVNSNKDGKSAFDGTTIDSEGYLWSGCVMGNRVIRWDTKTGEIVKAVNLPIVAPSSCAFGGPDFKTLLVTSIGHP